MFGAGQGNIGKGIADVLVQQLVGSEDYRVVERSRLDKVLAEQNALE